LPVTLSLRGSPDELVSQGLSQVPRCLFRLAAPGHRNEMLEKMMQGAWPAWPDDGAECGDLR